MSPLAANTRARLSADELHQLRWLLGLGLTLLAYWTLLSLDTGSGPWLWMAVMVVGVCLLFPRLPGRLPPWFWRAVVPVIVVVIVTDFILNWKDPLPALVRMVTLLTLYRCLQYRRRREDLQLVLLCLFMTVLSGVLTLSLVFAVQILLFAVMAMVLLFVINVQEPGAARALTAADWANFRWRGFLGRLAQGLNLRLSLLAAVLFAGLVAMSTVIFVAMPRFSFEHSLSFGKLKGESGFNEKISYGSIDSLAMNDTVAFRVDAPLGVVFQSTPYWRMLVLDEYKNNTFESSQTFLPRDYDRRPAVTYPENDLKISGVSQPPGDWKFYLEGDVSEYLPVLGPFGKLVFSAPQAFNGNSRTQVYRTDEISTNVLGYEITNMSVGDFMLASPRDEKALAKAHPDPFAAEKAPLEYPYNLWQLPQNAEDQAFLKKAVAEIRGESTDRSEMQFVKQAVDYLQKNHIASNSLSVASLPENSPRDQLVHWMESRSSGWCEQFAGAFTLLARAAGYPTRVVTGYKGATFNAIEHYYVVRETDAHAWAEIFDGKDRWLRVDPSPGAVNFFAGGPLASAAAPMQYEQGWDARLDSLRMLWYRRVINFDQTDQQEFASTLSQYGQVFWASLKARIALYSDWLGRWFNAPLTSRRLWQSGLVLAGLVAALLFRQQLQDAWLRLSTRGWAARWNRDSPVRRRAGQWLGRFEPAWQRLAGALPTEARDSWAVARHDLLALRYGPMETMPDPVGTFRRARALLREARRSRWRSGRK
jgi:transglutaminase-like putative cysteine protease